MTLEPRWLDLPFVLAVHSELIAMTGGSEGTVDMNRLLAALDRPRQKQHYEDPTPFDLAAAYAFGIAKGHPFTDGNKRVAITLAVVFLRLNGWLFDASEAETYTFTNALAAGELEEPVFSSWLERNSHPEEFRPSR